MTNQTDTRQKMIAKIHVGKAQLGMDDATYRALLRRVTGQESCSRMSPPQLLLVLDELVRLGFGHSMGKAPLRRTDAVPMPHR